MSVKLKTEDGVIVDFAAIGGTYANAGAATQNPLAFIGILNGTDQAVIVSIDGGATDSIPLPAYSSASLSSRDFLTYNSGSALLPAGSQFQVKHNGTAPTLGEVTIIRGYSNE